MKEKSDEHVAEEMQKKQMEKREEQLKDLQEVAKNCRRNVMKTARSKGVRPSSSSSDSYESDPEKAYMKKQKKPKEKIEKPEKPKEPEEKVEKPTEPEEANISVEGMTIAQAVRRMFRLDDVEALLEDEKLSKVNGVLADLENAFGGLPDGFGLRLQSMANEFRSWSDDLEEVIRRTEADIELSSDQQPTEATSEKENALTLMAEAQLMQATAESNITAAKEKSEKLEDGRETAKSVLDTSTEYAEDGDEKPRRGCCS